MSFRARRSVAAALTGALIAGSWPGAALAQGPISAPPAAPAAPAPAPVAPSVALDQMRQWGVYKGDGDVLKTYLGDSGHLTPLGRALYLTLIQQNDARIEKRALMEKVRELQPQLDKIRENGRYDGKGSRNMEKAVKDIASKFNMSESDIDNSAVWRQALLEKELGQAAVADPLKPGDQLQVNVEGGYLLKDAKGIAFKVGAGGTTLFSRPLLENQKLMNQSRPPEVPFIPETGTYSPQMLDYSKWRLINQTHQLLQGLDRERMTAIAELLGKLGNFRDDMWLKDERIRADLIAEAKATTYRHLGKDYSVLDIVDERFAARMSAARDESTKLDSYLVAEEEVKEKLGHHPVMSEEDVQNLSLLENQAVRSLNFGVIEALIANARSLIEHIDPASPDAEQVMKSIDHMKLSDAEKIAYKNKARDMVRRLQQIIKALQKTRDVLAASDATSMETANAALVASQKELMRIYGDYSMYVQLPSLAFAGQEQLQTSMFNYVGKGLRKGWEALSPDYAQAMHDIRAGQAPLIGAARLVAAGKMGEARQAVIAMSPDAVQETFSAGISNDLAQVNDAARIAASMKIVQDRVTKVFEQNKWLDSTGNLASFAITLALTARPMGSVSTMFANKLDVIAAKTEGSFFAHQGAVFGREVLQHFSAQLATIEPQHELAAAEAKSLKQVWGQWAGESALITARRAAIIAKNQLVFSGTSAIISGTFTAGGHFWDKALGHILAPGQSLTIRGHGLRPSTSMFGGAGEAFWLGFKGGYWWANTPMALGTDQTYGAKWFNPAWLGYIGLPSTAFTGTSGKRFADVLASKGVVGAGFTFGEWGIKGAASWLGRTVVSPLGFEAAGESMLRWGTVAHVGEEAIQKGFIENLMERGTWQAKAGAYMLSMADQVGKYAIFSDVVGWAGRRASYGVEIHGVDFGGGKELDVERRIRRANLREQEWMASPAWLLLPTFSGKLMRDSALFMRAEEGAKELDAKGLTKMYAGKTEARLQFQETHTPSMLERVLGFAKTADAGDYWIVTKDVAMKGLRKLALQAASADGKEAKPGEVSPLRFYENARVENGKMLAGIEMTDDFRLAQNELLVQSLRENPKAAKIFDPALKLGSEVPELGGRITPKVQEDLAGVLLASESKPGAKRLPRQLKANLDAIMAPYTEAHRRMPEIARELSKAVEALPKESAPLMKSIKEDVERPLYAWGEAWEKPELGGKRVEIDVLLKDMRERVDARARSGELPKAERAALTKMIDYLGGLDDLFNAFNSVDRVRARANKTFEALKIEHGGEAAKTVDAFKEAFEQWAQKWSKEHPNPADAGDAKRMVAGARSDDTFAEDLIPELRRRLDEAKPRLSAGEYKDLSQGIKDAASSPFIFHDAKGSALENWRPAQFVSMTEGLTAIVSQGESAPRVFQKLMTGGGKTPMAFIGLRPFVEADAARRGLRPLWLTVQQNLYSQGVNDFMAYKIMGSKLEFDLFENFKAKIAEGKSIGMDITGDYWILADEFDGAALQAALTLGMLSGSVSRYNPVFKKMDERDTSLREGLLSGLSQRGTRALGEAQRVLSEVDHLQSPGTAEVRGEAARLEKAAKTLKDAKGPEARLPAEAELRETAGRLKDLLGGVPSRDADAVARVRGSLERMTKALDEPASTPESRADALRSLEKGVGYQQNVLRLAEDVDFRKLSDVAAGQRASIEGEITRLRSEETAARSSKEPGAAIVAEGKARERVLLEQELSRVVDAIGDSGVGRRLADLHERIAATESRGAAADAKLFESLKARESALSERLGLADRAASDAHLQAERDIYALGRKAAQETSPAAKDALAAEFEAKRGEAERLKERLAGASAPGDVGGMMKRLQELSDQASALEGKVREARALGADAKPESARLKEVRAQEAILRGETLAELRRRFNDAADEAIALVRQGGPEAEETAARLLSRRRELLEAFAGGENPVYSALRDMNGEAERLWRTTPGLQSKDKAEYEAAKKKVEGLIEGPSLWKALPSVVKLVAEVWRGEPITVDAADVGLTRIHAAKMLRALGEDPTMPVPEHDSLFWSLTSSLLWPGEAGDSSWARTRLISMLQGWREEAEHPGAVYYDKKANQVLTEFNGRFLTMDIESLIHWQLKYGADLTMPYTNAGLATVRDITTNKNLRIFGFSATEGEFGEHLREQGYVVSGRGSVREGAALVTAAGVDGKMRQLDEAFQAANFVDGEHVVLRRAEVEAAPAEIKPALDAYAAKNKLADKSSAVFRFDEVKGADAKQTDAARAWLRRQRAAQADTVRLLRGDAVPAEFRPAVDAYKAEHGLAGRDAAKIRASDLVVKDRDGVVDPVKTKAAQDWLRGLRAPELNSSLVEIVVHDTPTREALVHYLKTKLGVADEEIAMFYPDAEYLRKNVPEEQVDKKINKEALTSGRARVLILQASVGGRGLDLNFAGEIGDASPKAFRGYTNHAFLEFDPHMISGIMDTQAMGRISTGRVLPGAGRDFTMVMDIADAAQEPVFHRMLKEDPLFSELRADPKFVDFARARGVTEPDWKTYDDYVRSRGADGTQDGQLIDARYEDTLRTYLGRRQAEVEAEELRASSAKDDGPEYLGRFPGVKLIRSR